MGTPALLASGRMEPRKVIGSIDTSECLVAIAASLGFFVGLGGSGVVPSMAVAILVGGLIAAPIAAWLVRHVPPRLLGSAVGGLIVFTNVRSLLRSDWIDASAGVQQIAYLVVAAIWVGAVAYSFRAYRVERAEEIAAADARGELVADAVGVSADGFAEPQAADRL